MASYRGQPCGGRPPRSGAGRTLCRNRRRHLLLQRSQYRPEHPENFVSINNCISVDLYGQICAESAGTRQISGTGGQLDFLEGRRCPPAARPSSV